MTCLLDRVSHHHDWLRNCSLTETFNASAAALRGSIPFEVSSLVNLGMLLYSKVCTCTEIILATHILTTISLFALFVAEVLDLGSSQNRLGKYRDELFSLPNLREYTQYRDSCVYVFVLNHNTHEGGYFSDAP